MVAVKAGTYPKEIVLGPNDQLIGMKNGVSGALFSGEAITNSLPAVGAGGSIAAATQAQLIALAGPFTTGQAASVRSDTTPAKNGIYNWSGAGITTGVGGTPWTRISDLPEVSLAATAVTVSTARSDAIAAADAASKSIGFAIPRLLAVGDSIFQFNHAGYSEPSYTETYSQPRGEVVWAHAL
jgi:hypothetical protein